MEEQEEGIFAEIKKHSEITNDTGKIVEVKLVAVSYTHLPIINTTVIGNIHIFHQLYRLK